MQVSALVHVGVSKEDVGAYTVYEGRRGEYKGIVDL